MHMFSFDQMSFTSILFSFMIKPDEYQMLIYWKYSNFTIYADVLFRYEIGFRNRHMAILFYERVLFYILFIGL